jgi:hypothetical protein
VFTRRCRERLRDEREMMTVDCLHGSFSSHGILLRLRIAAALRDALVARGSRSYREILGWNPTRAQTTEPVSLVGVET